MAADRGKTDYFDNSRTGHPSQVIGKLKAQTSYFSKDASVEYIGMTSKSLESRNDAYKKDLGVNEMRELYKTSSLKNATEVEQKLISFSEKNHSSINANRRDGGGGRLPETESGKTEHIVYAAYKHKT